MAVGIQVVLGVALGAVFCGVARWLRAPRFVFALGLTALAVYYVIAAIGSGVRYAMVVELIGLVLFGTIAVAGMRGRHHLLAGGWLLHVIWDVVLHTGGRGAYVPAWYPMLCVGFDLFVAGFILWFLGHRTADARE